MGAHGGESRIDVAERSVPLVRELVAGEPEWGRADHADQPVVLVAHGGLIAALTAALLRLPVENWPILGGMANASWTQLSGYSDAQGPDDFDAVRWRLDVWNASAQVAAMSSEPRIPAQTRPTLLVFADSLSITGPPAAPADHPDLAEPGRRPAGLGCRTHRPHRLDQSRRVVGVHPGPAGVGRTAPGGCGHLRHQRDGLLAVGVADGAA